MKISLMDDTVIYRDFSPLACTGYRAKAIEIGPRDIQNMRHTAQRDPHGFATCMRQLEGRFFVSK